MTWDKQAGQEVQGVGVVGAWPGSNTPVGGGLAGKVDSFTTHESTRRRGETYDVAHIAGAIAYTPTSAEGGTLERFGDDKGVAHVVVGAWLANLLSPDRVPVGTFISITFDGVSARGAKMYTVRTVDRAYLAKLHTAATQQAAAPKAPPATARGDDDDRLPF